MQLKKPEFVKVQALERERSGYNVYVKVMEVNQKVIQTKNGQKIPMVDAVVADQTAAAKAFFKGANTEFIKQGNVIAIRNGLKKLIKGHISLQLDMFGRVTKEDKEIEASIEKNISTEEIIFAKRNQPRRNIKNNQSRNFRHNQPRRQQNNRRQDRNDRNDRHDRQDRQDNRPQRPKRNFDQDYNRNQDRKPPRQHQKPNRYDEKPRERGQRGQRGQRGGDRGERNPLTKINQIDPGQENIRFLAKVISVKLVQGKNSKLRCVLGDETGVVNAFLPELKVITAGASLMFSRAEARVQREHIEIQLPNIGKVEEARKQITKVNENFNLSEKSWVPLDS